jgi:hypothetical protein
MPPPLSLWPDDARVLGRVPQHRLNDVMSRSHLFHLDVP